VDKLVDKLSIHYPKADAWPLATKWLIFELKKHNVPNNQLLTDKT
jgi:hypothetical protein